jgi:hypothetical protein
MMDSVNKDIKGESSKENGKKKEMSNAPDKKEYKTSMLRLTRNRRMPLRYLEYFSISVFAFFNITYISNIALNMYTILCNNTIIL